MSRLKADLSLLLAAFIWGVAFVAQKRANESMGPVLFVGCRFAVSALLLAPFAWIEGRRSQIKMAPADWRLAMIIGVSLFAGMAGQQVGMVTTSATNAGFLTALYVSMVPLVAWLLYRRRPRVSVGLASGLSVVGAWLLEWREDAALSWSRGDVLILASDVGQAMQITLVTQFLARMNRPFLLSLIQYLVIALLGLALGLCIESVDLAGIGRAMPAILFAGIFSGGLAFTLQIVAQRHTPAAEAAIIMSLECVFAAVAGAWLLQDRLGPLGMVGCCLILAGVLLVQLAPLGGRANPLDRRAAGHHDAAEK